MTAASSERFDVIVVGAGPAGASAAYDLARAGLAVLLLDKAEFPRTKPCAGGLTAKALARLRFSVAPVIRSVSSSVVVSDRLRRERRLSATAPICALTLRSELDAFLLEKAVGQGACFRVIRGLSAIEVREDGVSLRDRSGVEYRAGQLLGADGARSQVRRLATAFRPADEAFALEGQVAYRDLHEGARPGLTLDFGVVAQGYGWLFPKHDHVNVGLYTRSPGRVKIDRAALSSYARQRLGVSQLDRVVGAVLGTGGQRYVPASERVLLIGDAAGFVDPLLGEGLYNAIKSGQQAARALLDPGTSYRACMRRVQEDVGTCRAAARLFYRFVPAGVEVIRRRPVSRALVEGFAAGRTLTEIRDGWLARRPVREAAAPATADVGERTAC